MLGRQATRSIASFPGPGQEAVKLVGFDLAGDDAFEDVLEMGEGVDVVEFGGLDQRGEDGPRAGSGIGAGEAGGRILLDVFQGQLELVGIEPLRLAAEPGPLQLLEKMNKTLMFGIGLFEGCLEVVSLADHRLEKTILLHNQRLHRLCSG